MNLELANFALTLAKTTNFIDSENETSTEQLVISKQWNLVMQRLLAEAYWTFNEREVALPSASEELTLKDDSWAWFPLPDSFINLRYLKPLRQSSFLYQFGLGRPQALNANLQYKQRKVGTTNYIGFPHSFWKSILQRTKWSIGYGFANSEVLNWPALFKIAFARALADSIYGALDDKPSLSFQDYLSQKAKEALSDAVAENNYLGQQGLPSNQWPNYEASDSSLNSSNALYSDNIIPNTYNYGD